MCTGRLLSDKPVGRIITSLLSLKKDFYRAWRFYVLSCEKIQLGTLQLQTQIIQNLCNHTRRYTH